MTDSRDICVRNKTALFFLDRLTEKGQPRTLHDLSSQFGRKGFTRAMRQIVGGSQSGLQRFLSQYPLLFTIRADYVSVTDYSAGLSSAAATTGPVAHDYAQEAADYFRSKLRRYGAGNEVPIVSLFGHRSQAIPEVRYASGRRVQEFRQFLQKFPEVFTLKGKVVMLSEDERKKVHPYVEVKQPEVDEALTAESLQFLQTFLSVNGPAYLDQLFNNICSHSEHEKWSKLFKTSQDLAAFIKIHSDKFSSHSDFITLVSQKGNEVIRSLPVEAHPTTPSVVSPPASPEIAEVTGCQQQTLKVMNAAENNEQTRNVTDFQSRDTSSLEQSLIQKLLDTARIVVDVGECRSIISSILEERSPVGVDAEGVNLGPNGPMTLLQVSTSSGRIYLFDLSTNRELMREGELWKLLECKRIIKVMHDCRNDSAALYHQFGVTLRNVFDTQVAYETQQKGERKKKKMARKIKPVSFVTVCRICGVPVIPEKKHMNKVYRHDQTFWARRPLTDDMIVYAAFDVMALVPIIYDAMNKAIQPTLRILFTNLCKERVAKSINRKRRGEKHQKKRPKRKAEIPTSRKSLTRGRLSGNEQRSGSRVSSGERQQTGQA